MRVVFVLRSAEAYPAFPDLFFPVLDMCGIFGSVGRPLTGWPAGPFFFYSKVRCRGVCETGCARRGKRRRMRSSGGFGGWKSGIITIRVFGLGDLFLAGAFSWFFPPESRCLGRKSSYKRRNADSCVS